MFRTFGLLVSLATALSTVARGASPASPVAERYVAIDNVCAWPNLTVLPDGAIIATIFGHPSHGRGEGDVECWATLDGRFWTKRGVAAVHEPGANRMNVAAGLSARGDLIVLSSGWSVKKDDKGKVVSLVDILPAWICRSSDGGKTWQVDEKAFPGSPEGFTPLIPFGDVLIGADGALRAACYAREEKTKIDHVWIVRSADDGRTWKIQSKISAANNETALFHVGKGEWIAAARALGKTKQRLDLWRSTDDGQTWTDAGPLSEAAQHPAHIARLRDGRLLLTYGNRIKGKYGVLAKLSSDNGRTWGAALTLVDDLLSGDCGYPASVQLPGGEILTAYYSNGAPNHRRYHMGTVIWKAPAEKIR